MLLFVSFVLDRFGEGLCSVVGTWVTSLSVKQSLFLPWYPSQILPAPFLESAKSLSIRCFVEAEENSPGSQDASVGMSSSLIIRIEPPFTISDLSRASEWSLNSSFFLNPLSPSKWRE